MEKKYDNMEAKFASEESSDILIIGAGHAGTAAALAALEAGASVTLLEQQTQKGFRALGAQVGVLNSRFLEARGALRYDPVVFMEDYLHRSLNRANPALIRQFAFHSGQALDWLVEKLPPEITENIQLFMSRRPQFYTGVSNGFRTFQGTAMFPNLPLESPGPPLSLTPALRELHRCIARMGGVLHYGISTAELLRDSGTITGAIGMDYQKRAYRFHAKKGVLLAAGDFSGNREMVMKYLTEFAELTAQGQRYAFRPGGRKGVGIQLGLQAGGHMEPGPRGGMWACVSGNGGPMDGSACLRLNCQGQRYTNEGIMGYWGAGIQGPRQPKGPIVTLWDANWRQELEYQAMDHTNVDFNDPRTFSMREQQMQCAQQNGFCEIGEKPRDGKKADMLYAAATLDELADKAGYAGTRKTQFLQSVQRYNLLCERKRDEDFAKDPKFLHPIQKPPYFCFQENNPRTGNLMVTVCGLVVDAHQQVVDDEGVPIPGLFATGNCSGERFPIMYTTPISGISIGMAYTLGREVGAYLAGKPLPL